MSSDHTPNRIDEAWVTANAAASELAIAPEHLSGVVATLQNVAKVAVVVNDVDLTAEDELAPIWKP